MLRRNQVNCVFRFYLVWNLFRTPVPWFRLKSLYFRKVERQTLPAWFTKGNLVTCIKILVQNPFTFGENSAEDLLSNGILFGLTLIWCWNELLLLEQFSLSGTKCQRNAYVTTKDTGHVWILICIWKCLSQRKHRKMLTLSFSIQGDLS